MSSRSRNIEETPPHLQRYLLLVDQELDSILGELQPSVLKTAAIYAATGKGKRLRPALVCLAADAVGGRGQDVLNSACAIELMHNASLVLDDLPCMDNARLRRHRQSCHLVFGEAQTILTALTLISLSFELIARNARDCRLSAAATQSLISRFSVAVREAAHGQSIDLAFREQRPRELADVEACYRLKTGAVLAVALATGAILGNGTQLQVAALEQFGYDIGVAFQMVDDMFDGTHSAETAGKATEQCKHAFLSEETIRAARPRVREFSQKSIAALSSLGPDAEALILTTQWVIHSRMERMQLSRLEPQSPAQDVEPSAQALP